MSTWFRDDNATPVLLEETIQIAWNFLEGAGEIDDPAEATRFLANKIEFMINGGPDLKHRFLRHIQLGTGTQMTPMVQGGDDGRD